MDVGFKEVGITFLVGAFTILGFGMIFYYIFDRSLAGFLRDHLEPIFKNNRSEAENIPGIHDRYYFLLHIAILIGFSFAVGIIVESLSEKYKDNTPLLFRTLFVSIGAELERFSIDAEEFGFPINEDDRVTVVVGFKDIGDGFTIMEPTPLGYELAAHDALVKGEVKEEGKKTVDEIEDKLMMCYLVYTECKNKPDCTIKQFCKVETKNAKDLVCKIRPDEKQKLTGLVTALYYRSKNVTYSYPNYYDEMSRIQMRQDFARSLSLLTLGLIFCVVVSGVFICCRYMVINSLHFTSWLRAELDPDYTLGFYVFLLLSVFSIALMEKFAVLLLIPTWLYFIKNRLTVLLLIFGAIYFFSTWAYFRQIQEFNKRAYGYYSTILSTGGNESPHKPN